MFKNFIHKIMNGVKEENEKTQDKERPSAEIDEVNNILASEQEAEEMEVQPDTEPETADEVISEIIAEEVTDDSGDEEKVPEETTGVTTKKETLQKASGAHVAAFTAA